MTWQQWKDLIASYGKMSPKEYGSGIQSSFFRLY